MFFRNTIDWDKARNWLLGRAEATLAELAEFTAERARVYCPVDTGELRASIQVIKSSGSLLYHVVATADHAAPVEFGHHAGGTWVPPNPFLRRALADAQREFPRIAGTARVGRPGTAGGSLGVTFAG